MAVGGAGDRAEVTGPTALPSPSARGGKKGKKKSKKKTLTAPRPFPPLQTTRLLPCLGPPRPRRGRSCEWTRQHRGGRATPRVRWAKKRPACLAGAQNLIHIPRGSHSTPECTH